MKKAASLPLSGFILSSALFVGFLPSSNASLIGQSVDFCFNGTYLGTVTTDIVASQCFNEGSAVVVDPGVEFLQAGGGAGGTARDVDLTADTISLIYNDVGSGSPDLFILSNLNWGITPGVVTGLTLLTADPFGITTSFTADSIALLVNNPFNNATVTFRILTSHVPLPSMLPMFVLCVLGMLVRCRRRAIT